MRIVINLFNLFPTMVFYAVAKGRCPGIYLTWEDCKKQVHQFTGAKYRKFTTENEAKDFIKKLDGDVVTFKSIKREWQEENTVKDSNQTGNSVSVVSHISKDYLGTKNFENALDGASIGKQLAQLERKHEEATRTIQSELNDLKEKFYELESRLGIVEKKMPYNASIDQNGVSSAVTHLNEVEKIFNEEFGLIKEKIKSFQGQQLETFEEEKISHRRQLREFLSKQTAPKAPCPRVMRIEANSHSGKRKYSTGSRNEPSSKTPKTIKLDVKDVLSPTQFIVNEEGYVEVYTDGACEKNGKRGAKAGIGVWFGDNHPLNISEPVVGKATNNMAEIQAATYAVETAKKAGVKKLLIHTDSNFLINCITQWINKWKKNGWRVGGGEPVKNKEELIVLDNKLQGIDVKWNHVRGHHGIHGNEMADLLAREGAKRFVEIECSEDFAEDF